MLVPPVLYHLPSVPFAYLGPNTVLPVASVLAAAIGVILVFWRYIVGMLKGAFRFLFRRRAASAGAAEAGEAEEHSQGPMA